MENIDYEALVKALKSRRFLPEVFDTAQEAKAAALKIIGFVATVLMLSLNSVTSPLAKLNDERSSVMRSIRSASSE